MPKWGVLWGYAMTLFINGNNLNNPYWGLPRVAFELIAGLDRKFSSISGSNPFGEVVLIGRNKNSPMPRLKNISYEYLEASSLYVWENYALAKRTGRSPLLGLQNRNPVFKENCATMIHGLQVLTQPDSYSRRAKIEARTILPLVGFRHRTIMTVSNFSAAEIAAHKVAKSAKIKVVYNGIDHSQHRTGGSTGKGLHPTPSKPYVVAQATTKAHKNIRVLLEAFSHAALSNFALVLFGNDGRAAFEGSGMPIPPNVEFAGALEDDALVELLKGAICLAFPSLTEGFGLPPLESMALGTPAIVSNGGAIPEVCGNATVVLNPHNSLEWVEAIIRMHSDSEHRLKYTKLGTAQARKFTWDAAADRVYQVLLERHI